MPLLKLRPYQQKAVLAILDSVYRHKGLTFSVEIARQGGKNEISAYLELILLSLNHNTHQNLIKCSPTFKPQTLISIRRLEERLNDVGLEDRWTTEQGYIIRLDEARAIFLSADESANVVGNTAHLLLEVDEAQDVAEEKYTKEFKPMGSTTNCTCVLYGTTWDDSTLLEKTKQENLELERRDGIWRHFRYDWQDIAQYNPDYLNYVENEKARLGANHPLFLTQYCLQTVKGNNRLFDSQQLAQMQGEHSRLSHPEERIVIVTPGNPIPPYSKTGSSKLETRSSKVYVAGLDLAGEAENPDDDIARIVNLRRDSTVITIGELDFSSCSQLQPSPVIKIVEHYAWTGQKHPELYARMVDILKNLWHCRRIVVDATGIGQPVASFLRQALGSRVVPFTFTQPSKSLLGFNLLAALNSGRLKIYAADNSAEYREFRFEMEKAHSLFRSSQTMNFYVDPADGHDDYLMSLALLVEAAAGYNPREARGS